MLNNTQILGLLSAITDRNTVVKAHSKTIQSALYSTPIRFFCPGEDGQVVLTPISVRQVYGRKLDTPTQQENPLLTTSIVCTTRNNVEDFLGLPVCITGMGFDMFGRLRRSKCDEMYRPFTGTNYIVLSLTTVQRSKTKATDPCTTIKRSDKL